MTSPTILRFVSFAWLRLYYDLFTSGLFCWLFDNGSYKALFKIRCAFKKFEVDLRHLTNLANLTILITRLALDTGLIY